MDNDVLESNEVRRCSECHEEKSPILFYRQSHRCKECEKKRQKLYYQQNKDRIKKRLLFSNRQYYRKNRAAILAKGKEKRKPFLKPRVPRPFTPIPPIAIKNETLFFPKTTFDQKQQGLLFDGCHGCAKKLRKNHLGGWMVEYLCEKCQEKRKRAAHWRAVSKVRKNLRRRLKDLLKNSLAYKGIKPCLRNEMSGCTSQELKIHLEKQFRDGMSWENYGQWHIDHIKPIASFDLSQIEEQKKANHFTNLQPLWARENLLKKDHESIITV